MINLELYGKQLASWLGLLDIAELMPEGWTLAGGQLVYMHLTDRGSNDSRPTNDIDAVIDVRGRLNTPVQEFAATLTKVGFIPVVGDPSGNTHRWVRGDATIDILIPRFLRDGVSDGTRSEAGRITTIATAGGQFLLDRSLPTRVNVSGHEAVINAPDLLGAMYGKASALLNVGDVNKERHVEDLLLLAAVADHRELQSFISLSSRQQGRLLNSLRYALNRQSLWHTNEPAIIRSRQFIESAELIALNTDRKAEKPRLSGKSSLGEYLANRTVGTPRQSDADSTTKRIDKRFGR